MKYKHILQVTVLLVTLLMPIAAYAAATENADPLVDLYDAVDQAVSSNANAASNGKCDMTLHLKRGCISSCTGTSGGSTTYCKCKKFGTDRIYFCTNLWLG